jgi:hypothetical protein
MDGCHPAYDCRLAAQPDIQSHTASHPGCQRLKLLLVQLLSRVRLGELTQGMSIAAPRPPTGNKNIGKAT